MNKIKITSGMTFGDWSILCPYVYKSVSKKWYHYCKCSCGNIVSVQHQMLKQGKSKRCKRCHNKWMKTSKPAFKHGGSYRKLYRCFSDMMSRCYNMKNTQYVNYGGRGIRVTDSWYNDRKAFKDWALSNGYGKNKTIERIDVNGNYSPENCKFIPKEKQARNTRKSRRYSCFGDSKIKIEWCEDSRCKVSFSTLTNRLNCGWSIEDALTFSKKPGVSYKRRISK